MKRNRSGVARSRHSSIDAANSAGGSILVWLLIAVAAPLGFLAQRIPLDLWYDEIYTLVHFVHRPWTQIVTDYSAPNNHIAYSLLLRPLWLLGAQPLELRLSSYVLAAGTLTLTFALAWRLLGRDVAVWATALLGLTQMYLSHAIQVRGYGLSMLLIALVANLAVAAGSTRNAWRSIAEVAVRQRDFDTVAALRRWWSRATAIALVVALSVYTIPTNVLFVVPLLIWSVARSWRTLGSRSAAIEMAPWLSGLLLAGLFYLPVLDQLRQHAAGSARPSLPETIRLAGDVLLAAGHDAWPLLPLIAIGLLCWLWRPHQSEEVSIAWLLGLGLMGPFLIAWAIGISPFVRSFCPVLPLLAIAVAWSGDEAITAGQRFARRAPAARDKTSETAAQRSTLWRPLAGLALLLAVFTGPLLTFPSRLTAVREREGAVQDGYYNFYAANFEPAQVVDILAPEVRIEPNFQIAYDDADYYNLIYYLIAEGIATAPEPKDPERERSPGYLYLVLPPKPNIARLQARIAIPAREWLRWPQMAQVGYYRILRSPQRRSLAEFQKPAPAPKVPAPPRPYPPSLLEELNLQSSDATTP
ncbi:MAG: hypothetical protein AB7O68_24310 [Pirellulales bacterium]